MIKEMLIKGGAIVVGILVAEAIVEKLEKASLKRDIEKGSEEAKEEEMKLKVIKIGGDRL